MRGVTMAEFCQFFTDRLDRGAIDKTGLAGKFDIHLDLTMADIFPAANASGDPPVPSDPAFSAIFAAVKKLGLKLEPSRGPREFIVIDHVEKPAEN
jgi:uncharacterized protein (TIGR03435 family)